MALVASLALGMASMPGLALADQTYGAPDDYLVDLELVRVQALLADKGFYRGPVDGFHWDQLDHAIMAFHKAADLERSPTWLPGDMEVLSAWEPQLPEVRINPIGWKWISRGR